MVTARPSARYVPSPRDELVILHAKARVCDAYRRWLESPTGTERAEICDALAALADAEEK